MATENTNSYEQRLNKLRERDLECFNYHREHPEAKLCNARDRRAGFNSRQSVWAAIKRVEKLQNVAKTDLTPSKTA